MAHYADKRFVLEGSVNPRDLDNEVIALIVIPANKEVEVYDGYAQVDVVSGTASAKLEFVDESNSDAIWCVADVKAAAGLISMVPQSGTTGGTTYPFKIPSSTTARSFALKLDKNAGTGASYSGVIIMSDPGHRT